MDAKTQHGYLVIADISGFTSYLAKVELEHAHEILTSLLESIVKEFKTLLTISKLEGDAVFAYAPEENTPGGERILEVIENTYVAFRQQRETSRRNTTCTCKACQSIPSLDLKFFVHHGDFIVQEVSGIRELVGSDVNLIHRLMKNHITENTGWTAYILFTSQALEHMQVQPEGLHQQLESYEHLGDIQVLCLDLHERYKAILEAKRVIVLPEEAEFYNTFDFEFPPPVIWHWLTNIEKKTLVGEGVMVFTATSRPGGRNGVGASNHCAHGRKLKGSLIESILDWRPFDYFTVEWVEGKMVTLMTYKLEPISNGKGTRLHHSAQMTSSPIPRFLRRLLFKSIISKSFLSNSQAIVKYIARETDAGKNNNMASTVTE
jgi:hypothetical protein